MWFPGYRTRDLLWLLVKALFGLSLLACELEPVDIVGDESFTAEERERVQIGATWLYAQVGEAPPRIGWTGVAGSPPSPKTIVRGGRNGNAGLCQGGAVYLDTSSLEDLPGLAAHELAHCRFAFVDRYHASEASSDGIMRVLSPMRWTDSEREQCRASTACPEAGR